MIICVETALSSSLLSIQPFLGKFNFDSVDNLIQNYFLSLQKSWSSNTLIFTVMDVKVLRNQEQYIIFPQDSFSILGLLQ